jgi:hypothetical protein
MAHLSMVVGFGEFVSGRADLLGVGAGMCGYVGLMEPEKTAVRRGSIDTVTSITTWS